MTAYEMRHATKKMASTISILFRLGMARTFGRYEHTVWNGEMDYAVYHWRGERWAFPKSPLSSQPF